MAVVGTATLNVVPKFPGFKQAVQSELDSAEGSSRQSGSRFGQAFGSGATSGLAKSGAVIGAFSAVTTKALDSISSHVGDAISRFDTLNNYPVVMQTLGYSAESVDSSLSKMDERLQGLPTSLDSMVSLVQGLVTTTGDLGQATDAGLALNDMLVASGSSTQLTSAAMEQFRQILAKGKPEMQDWRSLTSAMPGQMDQLAKSMLGATADANDLYAALGGGKNEAVLSMDDLLDAMIALDQEGSGSIKSFEEQARSASGGVATSMANMGTAVTRGIANVMEAVGKENISEGFADATGAVKAASSAIVSAVEAAMPAAKGLYSLLKDMAPTALTGAAAFAAYSKAAGFIDMARGRLSEYDAALAKSAKSATGLGKVNAALGTSFTPVGLGIAAATVAVSLGAAAYNDWKTKAENAEKATVGLAEAVANTGALDSYKGTLSDVASQAEFTAMGVDELHESMAQGVDAMAQTTADAESQVAMLNTAQQIIGRYAGQTDLTTQAQGELEWALSQVNEQFGLSLTAADAMAGSYKNANGETVNLKKSIDELVESKKAEIRQSAIESNLTEAYQMESDAAKTAAAARVEYNQERERYIQNQMEYAGVSRDEAEALADVSTELDFYRKKVEDAEQACGSASGAVEALESELGDHAKSVGEDADAWDRWGNTLSQAVTAQLEAGGQSLQGLKEDMRSLNAETEDLASLSEDQLIDLAMSYDGTTASIVGELDEWGVGMDEAKQRAAEAASGIAEALSGMDGVGEALSGAGVGVSDFSQRLAEAGVSAEQLNEVGSASIAQLASSCSGDLDAMTWYVQHFNDTPILDKDGSVQVSDGELIDAQGDVYAWNGTALLDKDGKAVVDDRDLQDGQGNLVEWNGTALRPKSGTATAHTDSVQRGIDWISKWNSQKLANLVGSATVTVTQTVDTALGKLGLNAAGGIRPHADGGVVPRYHAGGAIAARAVPLDIVGEAGAEAIVPLTNRRYSQPFVDLIADGVGQRLGGRGDTYIIDGITYDDGSAVAQAMSELFRAAKVGKRRR